MKRISIIPPGTPLRVIAGVDVQIDQAWMTVRRFNPDGSSELVSTVNVKATITSGTFTPGGGIIVVE